MKCLKCQCGRTKIVGEKQIEEAILLSNEIRCGECKSKLYLIEINEDSRKKISI